MFNTESLGYNAIEYAQPMDPVAERAELSWAKDKLRAINQSLGRTGNVSRLGDIGCRGGLQALSYGVTSESIELHGFEISEAALAPAAARGIETHVWVAGQTPCPVPDFYFDVLIAGDVIEHIFDTDSFLAECYRVIRPEGMCIVTTPNLAWWWSRLRLAVGMPPSNMGSVSPIHSFSSGIDIKHLRIGTIHDWNALFFKHGFRCNRVRGYTYPLLRPGFRRIDKVLTRRPTFAHSVLFELTRQ